MLHSTLLAAAAVLLVPAAQASLYSKGSPVLQVTGKNYAKLIEKSPYTSMVEFYAPWCGHCKNLQPFYEKAATSLKGLGNVAAVNCDAEENKQFCGSMGIEGFPTLKIVRPSKKSGGKPMVEDYRGERNAKGIVNAVTSAINNHVKRLQDKDRDDFMQAEGPKALLFSDKGTTSATIKVIAIDFLDIISVAQVRNNQRALVDEFGLTEFPSLVLIPAEGDFVVYEGEMKKQAMVDFLSQAGTPRTAENVNKKDKKAKKEEKPKPKEAEPEPSQEPEQAKSPIPVSLDGNQLALECFNMKSSTCILAFVPDPPGDIGAEALNHLADIYTRHKHANRKLLTSFVVPKGNTAGDLVIEQLQLPNEVELVAINARRRWWKHFDGVAIGFTQESIEAWIDEIRMGEGTKMHIPSGIVVGVIPDQETDHDKLEGSDPVKNEDQAVSDEKAVTDSSAETTETMSETTQLGGADEEDNQTREHEEL